MGGALETNHAEIVAHQPLYRMVSYYDILGLHHFSGWLVCNAVDTGALRGRPVPIIESLSYHGLSA